MKAPMKLQGTDGIRGPISTEEFSTDSLSVYLESGLLTPEFFELYGYSFGRLLREKKLANLGDEIAVGWDGRDVERQFDTAFCVGITKAGLNAGLMGRIPTPAVPLFMLENGLRGAAMLTASHNPADQHGIKLFLPSLGMKFLPKDDELLTKKIFAMRSLDLSTLKIAGDMVDRGKRADAFFVSQSLDPQNSWITEDVDLSSTLLVLDSSNGAAAQVAEKIFGGLGLFDLKLANQNGRINDHAGVADIEGEEELNPADLEGKFQGYPFIETFFEQAGRAEVAEGKIHLVGLVFDGDADRCYRVDYDPESHRGLVSSGDLLGFQLAQAMPRDTSDQSPSFAFTVESDLNLGEAAQGLGYTPVLCGVGDKWLLRHGAASLVRSQSASSEFAQLADRWLAEPNPSALELCSSFEGLLKSSPWVCPAALDFALGLEESGHALSPFYVQTAGETKIGFAGNGIKAGLNSLAAYRPPFEAEQLREPFAQGVKQTLYVYYVDQPKLAPDHPFRTQLTEDVLQAVSELGEGITGEIQSFSEEPSLLFCHVKKQGKDYGAVFIRNSGTENKSAFYVRGPKEAASALQQLADQMHLYLLKNLKNSEDPLAQLERGLLEGISRGEDPRSLGLDGPVDRVLKEMELKQGLIRGEKGRFTIAEKGQALL